jgi:hypothetical protein
MGRRCHVVRPVSYVPTRPSRRTRASAEVCGTGIMIEAGYDPGVSGASSPRAAAALVLDETAVTPQGVRGTPRPQEKP